MISWTSPLFRLYPAPIDSDSVFETWDDMQAYLSTGRKYAGQIATCTEIPGKLFVLGVEANVWSWDELSSGVEEQWVDDNFAKKTAIVYNLVIRTPAEFNAMIESPTWFDTISVAFVGQFTLSTPDNSGVKRPSNVTRIDGYNNAKITVTNFKHNSTTAKGGFWDDGNANNPPCYINNLTVDCTGIGSYGFRGSNNTYTNCTGTGTSIGSNNSNGFYGSNNIYTNCTGTGTGTDGGGRGFSGENNIYTNCTGTGTGGYGYGFDGYNSTYTNCTGTGTGTDGFYGCYGFEGYNNRIISCTALAYISTDRTPTSNSCVPIHNDSTNANLFMIIRDCKFPQIAKTGYKQGTIWCNIANNTTMVGSIKDNLYHSRFTVAPIKGENVVADNNSEVDITAI